MHNFKNEVHSSEWKYNPLSRTLTNGKVTFYNVIAQDTDLTIFNNQWFVESVIDCSGIVEGYQLISVGRLAFCGCKSIKTVLFPGVKTIWDGAFESCTFLTTASLPDAITIGNDAFLDCTSLNCILLPNAVIIGENSFENCINLQSVSLPNVSTIGENAFKCCLALREISLFKITNIVDYAFAGCTSLKSLIILGEAPTLGANVFTDVFLGNITLIISQSSQGYDCEPWCNMQQKKVQDSLYTLPV